MLDVEITIKSIEVGEYTKEGLFLKITFNDGQDKALKHNVNLKNEEEAEVIIKKIRDYEIKENQQVPTEGETLSGMVNILIKDEEEVTKQMNKFLYKLTNNLKNVTSSRAALNYLQTISNIKNLRLDFLY